MAMIPTSDDRFFIEKMRVGQREAFITIKEGLANDKRNIAIVLPTRYGKSDVIRMVAFDTYDRGECGPSLVLNLNTLLRDQLVMPDKVNEMITRYGARFTKRLICNSILGLPPNPCPNGEALISATIQLVQRNVDLPFGDWIKHVYECTGRRVLVWVDEAHTGSQSNRWGETSKKLVEYGATVILLTATPYRADSEVIQGFEIELVSEESVRRYIRGDGSHPGPQMTQVFEGCKRVYRLKPDYEYTLKSAWEEKPLPIAKLDWLPFAVLLNEVQGIEATDSKLYLSELNESEARSALGRVVRSPIAIEHGVKALANKLTEVRRVDPKLQAIVFCGNDEPEAPDFNAHAKQIKEQFRRHAPNFRVKIATSTIEDELGKDAIEAFRGGGYDVLIVKQMASLGLDIMTIKLGLDLSTVRSAAAYLQKLMRIATIYENFAGIWIAPDEPIGKALFERFIEEEGGQAETVEQLELVDIIPTASEESKKTIYTVDGTDLADFGDSDQNWADAPLIHQVNEFRKHFPAAIGSMTHAAIAAKLVDLRIIIPVHDEPDREVRNVSEDLFTLRETIFETMKDAILQCRNRRCLNRDSTVTYGETAKELWLDAYELINEPFVPLQKQYDLAVLRKLAEAADKILRKWAFSDRE